MFKAIRSILTILAAIASYYSNKQLLDAGKAEAESDVLKENNKAREQAKAVKREVNTLPADNVSYKLREKYSRD